MDSVQVAIWEVKTDSAYTVVGQHITVPL